MLGPIRKDSVKKYLMLGKIESGRRRGQQRMRWLDGRWYQPTQWRWVWVNSGSWWWTGKPGVLQSMGLQRVRHDWVTGLNWKMKWEKPCPDNIMSPWIKLYMKADTLRFLSYIKQWISFWIKSDMPFNKASTLQLNTSPNTITVLHPTHFTHLCFLPDFCRIWVQSFYIYICVHI